MEKKCIWTLRKHRKDKLKECDCLLLWKKIENILEQSKKDGDLKYEW